MGWNQVYQSQPHPMWNDIADGERFYYVHSYYVAPQDQSIAAGTTDYPMPFTCAIAKDNLFAVQFHPEVHHTPKGAKLYENFIRLAGFSGDWTMGLYREQAIAATYAEGLHLGILVGGALTSAGRALITGALDRRDQQVHPLLLADHADIAPLVKPITLNSSPISCSRINSKTSRRELKLCLIPVISG